MIIGTLTVRYRDHRIADDKIEGVPERVYEAMATDLEIGDYSTIQAYEIPNIGKRRVVIVKATILSVSFTPTGEASSIPMPSWMRHR